MWDERLQRPKRLTTLIDNVFLFRPDLNMTDWVHVSHGASDDLWVPELTILNMVEMVRMEVMEEGASMRVRGDKTINIMYNLRIRVHCDMDLVMYPHDTQVGKENIAC